MVEIKLCLEPIKARNVTNVGFFQSSAVLKQVPDVTLSKKIELSLLEINNG